MLVLSITADDLQNSAAAKKWNGYMVLSISVCKHACCNQVITIYMPKKNFSTTIMSVCVDRMDGVPGSVTKGCPDA
jgi:hypothetical protein